MAEFTARRLIDLREDRAWSIRRLAGEAGVAPKTIMRIEAGQDIRPASVARIAAALGVEPMTIQEYREQRARTQKGRDLAN